KNEIMASQAKSVAPESFDSADFSLIPEQPPEEGEVNNMAESHYDLGNSFPIQDASMGEIQKRLVELVEDNESMKEALRYNNTLMKQQLSTISDWHTQMTASLSHQKISLEEANARIQVLEEENAMLRHKSISSLTISSESDSEADFDFVQAKKFKEGEVSRHELKKAQITISDLQAALNMQKAQMSSLQEVCQKIGKERDSLKEELLELNRSKLSCSQCEELKSQLKSLQENLSRLQESEMERVKLQETVKEVDELFVKEQLELEAERLKHKETNSLLQKYQERYNELEKQLHLQCKEHKEKREHQLSEREQEMRQSLEQMDNLTAKLFHLQQVVEERDEKTKQLMKQLDTLNREVEVIPILKAQVEVYKVDLANKAESSRKKIESLTREINELQSLVSFYSSDAAHGGAAAAASKSKGHHKTSAAKQEELICPICKFQFKDEQAIQNHVNRCLDKAEN
ncbi:uncharacterized protein CEXT_130661, partial [Caerostris extrusa]